MHPLSLLIKPASGSCNMRCEYCFYRDEAEKRTTDCFGIMSHDTLENLVSRALAFAKGSCSFVFQGGEPTLAGIDFYRDFLTLTKKYNTRGLELFFALQTNGYAIDREWARFLSESGFLVGLSLDGPAQLHDLYRKDAGGLGTFSQVMNAVRIFDSCGTPYNILTTVTADVAKNAGVVFDFFERSGFKWQQYIACLDPMGESEERGYSLTSALYGEFLKTLFDRWYSAYERGQPVSIRYFDNLLQLMLGCRAEACGMSGRCTVQYVIEADGGVYPCDFYVLDQYLMGNINTDDFDLLDARRTQTGFIERSLKADAECLKCQYAFLCRGGCRRERDDFSGGELKKNRFCEAYKEFFEYAGERLAFVAKRLRQERSEL